MAPGAMKSKTAPVLHRPRLSIAYVPTAKLKLNPKNPRLHSEKQIQQIARSVEIFGFNIPVAVDSDNTVVAGHGRVLAARLLGIAELPTISLNHLTETQLKAFMVADNRLAENSVWDDRLLAEQLKFLSEVELDFSLDVTGFEVGEIDVIIEGMEPAVEGENDPADALPESEYAIRVSQPGDLWLLGRHRIYCGNSLNGSSYSALMDGRRADMVFTDPPYNVKIAGHATGLGVIQHKNFKMASGEMSESEFTDFLAQTFTLLASHSIDGSLHYVFMDWRHMREILTAGKQVYTELKNLCIWSKGCGGMGSLYRSAHELVFIFKNGKDSHRNNVQLGQFGRYRTNVWNYPGANSFSRTTEEGNLLELHPTVKPVVLVADALMDCTARGDAVLDSFIGSGTTLIAAERTGRVCYGIELDPKYVDTAVRRWQAFTGLIVRHAVSGRTFNELEEEAANGHKQ
ncbi:MAG: DNA methyltransferase [Candidatus Sulfotelmatobacter sp.]